MRNKIYKYKIYHILKLVRCCCNYLMFNLCGLVWLGLQFNRMIQNYQLSIKQKLFF
jgi:hypothetical protein